MRERNRIADAISDIRSLEGDAADAAELWEMANSEGDEALLADVESLLRSALDRASQAEFKALLSGELDANNCYVEIHAGEGGTESQDWASMLRRMYVRWANRRGFKVEEVDEHSGEEAGIKSATLQITGDSAYGWLKGETGTHRLVRISPFDSNARRHTSFAAVSVYPVIDDTIQVEIEEKDVRVDTYRASGAGGQHINKTDSAVRLTHGPTGIVVSCQNDRSQHKNRAAAWDMLRARLYEMELKKREDAAQAEHDAKGKIGFGNSIRSYVLQPYQMVKDQRTAMETSDTQGVLDGDIDAFLAAALSEKIRSEE